MEAIINDGFFTHEEFAQILANPHPRYYLVQKSDPGKPGFTERWIEAVFTPVEGESFRYFRAGINRYVSINGSRETERKEWAIHKQQRPNLSLANAFQDYARTAITQQAFEDKWDATFLYRLRTLFITNQQTRQARMLDYNVRTYYVPVDIPKGFQLMTFEQDQAVENPQIMFDQLQKALPDFNWLNQVIWHGWSQ